MWEREAIVLEVVCAWLITYHVVAYNGVDVLVLVVGELLIVHCSWAWEELQCMHYMDRNSSRCYNRL